MKIATDRFEITSGMLACSDPCYEFPSVRVPAKSGNWIARAETSDQGEWGVRVSKIIAHHESVDLSTGNFERKHCHLGVDSGQAGFFDNEVCKGHDKAFYDRCCDTTLSCSGYGYVPQGFVSSSGFGDGCYCCQLYMQDGVTVGAEIIFIGDEYEEECDECVD